MHFAVSCTMGESTERGIDLVQVSYLHRTLADLPATPHPRNNVFLKSFVVAVLICNDCNTRITLHITEWSQQSRKQIHSLVFCCNLSVCASLGIAAVHQGTTASGHFLCTLQHFSPERSLTGGCVLHLDFWKEESKESVHLRNFLRPRSNITKVEQQVHVQHLSWEKLETEEQASQTGAEMQNRRTWD